jgi:hypothetical protein
VEAGTRGYLIEHGIFSPHKVRIATGPHAGSSGYIGNAALKKANWN